MDMNTELRVVFDSTTVDDINIFNIPHRLIVFSDGCYMICEYIKTDIMERHDIALHENNGDIKDSCKLININGRSNRICSFKDDDKHVVLTNISIT